MSAVIVIAALRGTALLRILSLLGVVVAAGCAVTLPSGQPFDEALLETTGNEESVLFVYSTPENRKSFYKYIFVDGDQKSTITTENFSRIVLEPGRHRVRVVQHGYKSPEPWIFKRLKNEEMLAELDATRDIELEPGSVTFLSLDRKKRPIYYECVESETATQICSREVTGLVIDQVSREVALSVLPSLHEVCESCE
ncbi:hypothetical protein [Lentisalinibacter salinarum]|uniref:hypothetical protein n=1 Tax=Lentisalinibacter salinarum TaxID=2992239 RepID=UPI0038654353